MPHKLTIEEMQNTALKRGGWCLSPEYFNSHTKIWWQCNKGHIWEAKPYNIKLGRWCPYCAGRYRAIEDMKDIAESRGGKCLSNEYITGDTKLKWKCEQGHIWEAVPRHIIEGHWCPKCAFIRNADRQRGTIEEMQNIAVTREGKCLSDKYVNANSKLKWECKEGHTWEATPHMIKHGGTWCPYCGGIARLTIEEMQEIAKQRGGRCLSQEYKTNRDKLKWECKEGHVWEAVPNSIKQSGTWCPYCSTGYSERVCRRYFEIIFKKKIPKRKPAWLLNNRGYRMELDGYCEELQLAFEYHGAQHYSNVPFYRRNYSEQIKIDNLKEITCKKNDVTLIIIPYTVKLKNMQKYIVKECKNNLIELPEKIKFVDYKTLDVYSPEMLKALQKIALDRGGKCLSNKYINSSTKLKWQCKNGHVWEANPNAIQQGHWCLICSGTQRGTIEEMKDIARNRGGRCLSKKYINWKTKLKWQCKEGHIWFAIPNNIKRGQWCPYCVGKHKTIKDMQELAKSRGGKCLSEKYVNIKTELKWSCKEGHVWESRPANILQGTWCPVCFRVKRNYRDFPHKHKF